MRKGQRRKYKMIADVCDRDTGEVLYSMRATFPEKPTDHNAGLFTCAVIDAERRIIKKLFEVVWWKK